MKNLRTKIIKQMVVSLFCALAVARSVQAQTYSIDWHSIDGGGGTSTGGVFSVTGTIGQPDAGTISGGNYTLTGGFWGIVTAVQMPGAPLLSVTRSNAFIIISWPDNNGGFQLENNANLANTNDWTTVAPTFATNNGMIFLTLPSPSGNDFYRLKKP